MFTTKGSRKTFELDSVHSDTTNQATLWSTFAPSVGHFTRGHNVSILVYGSTGSGKSYTLGTSELSPSDAGLIQRAARAIFHDLLQPYSTSQGKLSRTVSLGAPGLPPATTANTRKIGSQIPRVSSTNTRVARPVGRGHIRHSSLVGTPSTTVINPPTSASSTVQKPWTVTVSYFEIVNDQLHDLLNLASPQPRFDITEDAKGHVTVAGLKEIVTESSTQVLQLLDRGNASRQRSRCSHSIFTIKLTRRYTQKDTGVISTITSKFNFVDLANSDRQSSDLEALGTVLGQLNLPPTDISFNDSKLTQVLQDSLGNRAFTHLIACISKDSRNDHEILATLNFAQQLKVSLDDISMKELLAKIKALEKELKAYRGSSETIVLPTSPGSPSSSRDQSFSTSSPRSSDFDFSQELTDGTEFSIETCKTRADRSQEFHTAVELVLADYEKTISSLQVSLLESRGICKETQNMLEETRRELEEKNQELEQKSKEFEECQTDHFDLLSMAESLEQQLNIALREQHTERQLFEDQLKYAMSARPNSPLLSSTPQSNSTHHPISPSGSDASSSRQSLNGASDLQVEAELYLVREQLKACKFELKGLRAEHKKHGTESQYLTSKYNTSRHEAETLREENKELKEQLALLRTQIAASASA